MNEFDKQEAKDDFAWWVDTIPQKIIKLNKQIPANISDELNFSIESLDILEVFLLENYTQEDIHLSKENQDFFTGVASYIAETYKCLMPDLKWHIELMDESNIFYNMPVLRKPLGGVFSPHSLTSALFDRQRGNYLSSIVQTYHRRKRERKSTK